MKGLTEGVSLFDALFVLVVVLLIALLICFSTICRGYPLFENAAWMVSIYFDLDCAVLGIRFPRHARLYGIERIVRGG